MRWVVALHLCRGGQRVFSALAFKSLGHAGVCDMYLQAFQGASEVYALDRIYLLQALGLADYCRSIHDPGWVKLQSHVRPVENEVRDFTSSPSFFDETLALKCATALHVVGCQTQVNCVKPASDSFQGMLVTM